MDLGHIGSLCNVIEYFVYCNIFLYHCYLKYYRANPDSQVFVAMPLIAYHILP